MPHRACYVNRWSEWSVQGPNLNASTCYPSVRSDPTSKLQASPSQPETLKYPAVLSLVPGTHTPSNPSSPLGLVLRHSVCTPPHASHPSRPIFLWSLSPWDHPSSYQPPAGPLDFLGTPLPPYPGRFYTGPLGDRKAPSSCFPTSGGSGRTGTPPACTHSTSFLLTTFPTLRSQAKTAKSLNETGSSPQYHHANPCARSAGECPASSQARTCQPAGLLWPASGRGSVEPSRASRHAETAKDRMTALQVDAGAPSSPLPQLGTPSRKSLPVSPPPGTHRSASTHKPQFLHAGTDPSDSTGSSRSAHRPGGHAPSAHWLPGTDPCPAPRAARSAPARPPLAPRTAVIFSQVSVPTGSEPSTCGRGHPRALIGRLAGSHAPIHHRNPYWL